MENCLLECCQPQEEREEEVKQLMLLAMDLQLVLAAVHQPVALSLLHLTVMYQVVEQVGRAVV